MKKCAFLTLLLSSMCFSVSAMQWDYANLSLVGNYNGDYFVKATNIPSESNPIPSYSERLFKISDQLGKDGFAVALAAISSKKQVYMSSDIDTQSGAYPVISVIYITNKPAEK